MKDNLTEIKILEHGDFGAIRTTTNEQGNFLFCGLDVAKALGYADTSKAIKQHCKKDGWAICPVIDSLGRTQDAKFLTEGNVYRLIVKSKLPSAEAFETWVFDEVLPALRKHGLYASDELLGDDEKLLAAKELLKTEKERMKQEREKCKKLRLENKALLKDKNELLLLSESQEELIESFQEIAEMNQEIIEEQQSIIDYVDIILSSDLDMTATQIAADYGISAIRLNNLLHEDGIQRKVNGQWVLYRKFMNMGLTSSFTGFTENHGHCYVQTRWTQQGRLFIHQTMLKAGITPVCERNGEQYE